MADEKLPRVRYSPEFKSQVVKYVLDNMPADNRTAFMGEVGKKFGVYPNTIYAWMPGRSTRKAVHKQTKRKKKEQPVDYVQATLADVRKKICDLKKLEKTLMEML